jgi:DNA-binding XRE family transcriptional regulator
MFPLNASIKSTGCGTIIHNDKRGEDMKHEKIREYRMRKGWSQTKLAQELKIDRSYINQIENGKVTPSIALLERIANILDCNLKDFF